MLNQIPDAGCGWVELKKRDTATAGKAGHGKVDSFTEWSTSSFMDLFRKAWNWIIFVVRRYAAVRSIWRQLLAWRMRREGAMGRESFARRIVETVTFTLPKIRTERPMGIGTAVFVEINGPEIGIYAINNKEREG